MKTSNPKAFTLLELLCAAAIFAVLAALAAGAYSHVQESLRQTKCLHNLRQITTAVNLYAMDHGGRFPVFNKFDIPLEPYLTDRRVFCCPNNVEDDSQAHVDGRRNDYCLNLSTNEWVQKADGHVYAVGKLTLALPNPVSTFLCADATGKLREVITSTGKWGAVVRHSSGANYIFLDGHAKSMTPEEFVRLEEANMQANR